MGTKGSEGTPEDRDNGKGEKEGKDGRDTTGGETSLARREGSGKNYQEVEDQGGRQRW